MEAEAEADADADAATASQRSWEPAIRFRSFPSDAGSSVGNATFE